MKMHYLCLSLAVAIGVCLPASQLKATEVGGSDEVVAVVCEPAAIEGSQREQGVEVNEERAASNETLEVPAVNEDIIADEGETTEIEEATETVPEEGPFPSIMIAVFDAAEDAPTLESDDAPTDEFDGIDNIVEGNDESEATAEELFVQESAVAEPSESTSATANKVAETGIPTQSVETDEIVEEISEEAVSDDTDEITADEVADVDTEDAIEVAEEATSVEPAVVLTDEGFYVAVDPTLADATPIEEAVESETADEFR